MANQTTSLTIVYPAVYSGAYQIKHQSSASLAFVRGIHRSSVNSSHKWPATRKMFPFDDVILHGCLHVIMHIVAKCDIRSNTIWIVFKDRSLWWRHQMETFSTLLPICAGNSPIHGEFLAQRPVTRSFDVYFDMHPNKRLSKQSWGWWFETPSCALWRHCNDGDGMWWVHL